MEELITIWLVWTLINGQPHDVDAFMTKTQCETTVLERQSLLREAIAGIQNESKKAELLKWSIVGCTQADVTPGAVGNAQ